MNEQFQKLYEQSFVTDSYVNVGPDGTKLGIKFDPEKFAELIIQECADTAKNCFVYWPMDGSLQRTGCANAIKKHFGVE
jgi:hypothetical protein